MRASKTSSPYSSHRHPQGSLGLDDDPELAFAGIGALRVMAEFCETYQVARLRQGGYSWSRIASWAGINPQALHKKHSPPRGSGANQSGRSEPDLTDSPPSGQESI
jgi:hypothetical protein